MPKYRKKPVVIEAMQWEQAADAETICEWSGFVVDWDEETAGPLSAEDEDWGLLTVETLEGTHTATPGDWVIRGVAGEFYFCKPDIFEATYEPVTDKEEGE